MSNRRPKLLDLTEPRGITTEETAHYCGLSLSGFETKRPELEATGFPKPDPVLGRYDRAAVDDWFDNRSHRRPSLAVNAQGLDERLAQWEASA